MIKLKDRHNREDANSSRQHEEVISIIKRLTKHKQARLVQRGNAAIFCALCMAKKLNPRPFVLIPDQGGWISFKTYPKLLGFDVRTVKTNRGVIDLMDLEKKAESGAAFIVTSFAGYIAEQPMKYISRICRKNDCLLIEDASGALGDDDLCDGHYSDIIVGSFGKWKPINVEYGGFISTDDKEWFEKIDDAMSIMNHYPTYDVLLEKLKAAEQKMKSMLQRSEEVKSQIEKAIPNVSIIHKELRGPNVAARFANEDEKDRILEFCDSEGYPTVDCPKYIRLEEDAVCIELKRLDPLNGRKGKKEKGKKEKANKDK